MNGVIHETIAKVVLFVTGFAVNILLSKKGDTEFGYVGTFTSLLFVFELFLTNGVRQAIARVVSSYNPDTKKLWKTASITQLSFVIILIAVGMLIKNPLVAVLGIERYENLYLLIFLILPIEGIFYVKMGFLHGFFKYSKHALSNSVYSLVRMTVTIILLNYFDNGIVPILLGTAVGYVIGYLVGGKRSDIEGEEVDLQDFLHLTFGFLSFFVLVTIFLNLDILILNAAGITKDMVGQYKAATSLSLTIYYLLTSVTQVSLPIISKLDTENNQEAMRLFVNRILVLLLFLMAFAFVFFNFFAPQLILLFYGKDYLHGVQVLPLHALSMCLLSILIFLGNIYFALHKKMGFLFIILGGLVLYVGLTFLISGRFGLLSPPISLAVISIPCTIGIVALLNHNRVCMVQSKRLVKVAAVLTLSAGGVVFLYDRFASRFNPILFGIVLILLFVAINLGSQVELRAAFRSLLDEVRGKHA